MVRCLTPSCHPTTVAHRRPIASIPISTLSLQTATSQTSYCPSDNQHNVSNQPLNSNGQPSNSDTLSASSRAKQTVQTAPQRRGGLLLIPLLAGLLALAGLAFALIHRRARPSQRLPSGSESKPASDGQRVRAVSHPGPALQVTAHDTGRTPARVVRLEPHDCGVALTVEEVH